MAEMVFPFADSKPDAVENTCMAQLVVYISCVAAGYGRKQTEVGIVTGVKQKRCFGLMEYGDVRFQFLGCLTIAGYKSRPGGTCAYGIRNV